MRLMNIKPNRQARFYLAALPFVLLAIAYFAGSSMRLAENPNDKLLPALPTMAQAVKHMAFEIDVRTGTNLMLADTISKSRQAGLGAGDFDLGGPCIKHRDWPAAWR